MPVNVEKHGCTRISLQSFTPDNNNCLVVKIGGERQYYDDTGIALFGLPDDIANRFAEFLTELNKPITTEEKPNE